MFLKHVPYTPKEKNIFPNGLPAGFLIVDIHGVFSHWSFAASTNFVQSKFDFVLFSAGPSCVMLSLSNLAPICLSPRLLTIKQYVKLFLTPEFIIMLGQQNNALRTLIDSVYGHVLSGVAYSFFSYHLSQQAERLLLSMLFMMFYLNHHLLYFFFSRFFSLCFKLVPAHIFAFGNNHHNQHRCYNVISNFLASSTKFFLAL